jgi:hypothetical protein
MISLKCSLRMACENGCVFPSQMDYLGSNRVSHPVQKQLTRSTLPQLFKNGVNLTTF